LIAPPGAGAIFLSGGDSASRGTLGAISWRASRAGPVSTHHEPDQRITDPAHHPAPRDQPDLQAAEEAVGVVGEPQRMVDQPAGKPDVGPLGLGFEEFAGDEAGHEETQREDDALRRHRRPRGV